MRLPWKSSTSVDRSLEDESDVDAVIARNLWKHHRLLPPQSTFKHYWDLIMILFVFYSSVFIPMELAFMNSNPAITKHIAHRIFDYGVDIYFLIDIVVNFNTSFYDEDYQIVLERKKIAKLYLRTWFPLDFIAAFPFEVIALLLPVAEGQDGIGVTGLLKLPRLLRLSRLLKRLDQLASANVFRIVALMVSFMLIAHWIACLWWCELAAAAARRPPPPARPHAFPHPAFPPSVTGGSV